MISSKKKSLKRIWSGIIVFLIINFAVVVILTKVIYDGSFRRYDRSAQVPAALSELTDGRELLQIPCGEHQLCGYLYPGTREGLVVIAPGYHAGADDYLWQIKSFSDYGWGVLAFDPTGCCRSEGDSAVGFSQILRDLDAVLAFVEEQDRFGYEALLLFGHSRGGYGVCGAADEEIRADAIVAVSGVNSCMEAILQPVAEKVGVLAYSNYPLLSLYQRLLFGSDAATHAAEDAAASGIPTLVVQGAEDTQFPPDRYSIYAHRAESGQENIEYYLCAGGHTDLLFDADGSANDALMEKINQFFAINIGD